MAIVKNTLVLSVACVAVALGLIAPTGAAAAPPTISFEKNAPETALLGTKQKVSLVAHNPKGQPRGYNLSVRDVLPEGVVYVPGSAGENAPRVLGNKPGIGMTTLIFENLADLSPNSDFTIRYEVEPSKTFFKFLGGKAPTYTNEAEAFISEKARKKPGLDENGEPIPNVRVGVAEAKATTELTAIEIEKEEGSSEGEIPRGLHEHQRVFTLTVRNNNVAPTEGLEDGDGHGDKGFVIEDWLPAGYEFLGCGEADNTAPTKADPTAEEYPGSGPINPGNAPEAPLCQEPFWVNTENVDPPGKQGPGVYTHVKFLGPEELATGAEFQIQYIAAIPLRRNTVNWEEAAEPTPESLGQIANLNNNNGAETFDEEELTNTAQAEGEYESVAVRDRDEMTRTAEDIAIQKGTENTGESAIFDGAETNWTLTLETSEYRFSEPVTIVDHLPNGLCPIGPENYEGPTGAPIQTTEECEASTERHAMVKYVKKGPAKPEEKIEYSFVEEEKEKGGFIVEFNDSTVPVLKHLEPSQVLEIRFPTTTRTFYQHEYENANPVLTGDSWKNEVETKATGFSRCYTEGPEGEIEADPNCVGGSPKRIVEEEPTGTPIEDESSFTQEAGGVTIEKSVRKNVGPVPEKCKGSSTEYVKGLLSAEEKLPQYRPGDEICWRLVVRFSSDLYAGTPVVSDFIPPGETYVSGSEGPGPENTVTADFNESAEAKEEELLEWTITEGGEKTVKKGQTFEYRFRTKVGTSAETDPGEISGNLMKFLSSNTAGETFPQRDRAEVQREEPNLTLTKGITEVNEATVIGGPVSSEVAGGGQKVKYQLNVKNSGNLDAEAVEVWDQLPKGIECADVTLPKVAEPPFVECDAATDTIKWTGVTVEEATTTPLTYEVTVPKDVAPGHSFVNEAGVTTYKSETNTGKKFEYFPENNIDESLEEKANTGEIRGKAEITTIAATLEKTATTSIGPPGNAEGAATIGEYVEYTVTATIPANSRLYGAPLIEDELPATLKLDTSSLVATMDGGPLPPSLTEEAEGNRVAVKFKAPYPATPEAKHTIVLKYRAQVLNVPANVAGETVTNEASFEFSENEGGEVEEVPPASVGTPIVEPHLVVTKKNLLPVGAEGKVSPGETVEYETAVKNTGASTAYETVVTDTVPKGMKVVDPGAGTKVGNTIVWKNLEIAPGSTETLKYSLEVIKPAMAASRFTNVAVAETQSIPGVEGVEQPETRTSKTPGSGGYKAEGKDTVNLIDATVNKEVTPKNGTIGTELTYTLHMHLQPEVEYFNATMVDRLPKGVTYGETLETLCGGVKCATPVKNLPSESGPEGSTLLGWYFGNFAPAPASRDLTVEFKAHVNKEAVKGALTNVIGGFYNEEDEGAPAELPVPGSNTSLFDEETKPNTATTTVHEPALTLAKAVAGGGGPSGKLALPGNTYEYTLTVANTGDWPAYEFKVEDEPPANLTGFELLPGTGAPVTVTPISGAGEPPVWEVATLPAGETLELHYKAELVDAKTLRTGDPVENHAEVPTYFGLPSGERGPGTEFVEYPSLQAEEDLEVELPQITLTKTTGGGVENEHADVGDPFNWKVVVANTAEYAGAKEATVVDLLPEGWSYVEGSATANGTAIKTAVGTGNPQKLTWTLPSLGATEGGTPKAVEIEFEATPEVGATSGTNKAVIDARDEAGGEDDKLHTYKAEDQANAKIVAPAFEINKTPKNGSAVAGEPAAYDIEVKNIGTGDATQPIEVEDELGAGQIYVAPEAAELPAGVTQVSVTPASGVGPAKIAWTISSLKVGEAVHIPVPIEVPASGAEGSQLENSATVSSPQAPEPEADEGSFEVHREADLKIEKEADRTEVNGGEKILYTLKVTNEGPSDATGVTVTDKMPDGTKFLSGGVKSGPGTCNYDAATETVTCGIGSLPAGEPPVEIEVEVKVVTGRVTPIVNTAEVSGKEFDPELENNHSTKRTPIGGSADLSITKRGPSQPVLLGSTFSYSLEVDNEGPSDATEVEVTDELPKDLEFVVAAAPEGTTCGEAGGIVTCELGTILPGSPTVVIDVTVKAIGLPAGGKVSNTAKVSSPTPDPEPGNDESTAETPVLPSADLAITKAAPATVEPDGELTYALHVENLGPSPAHAVVVEDPLPAGVEFEGASEGCTASAGTVTCALPGELPVGGEADLQVTVHVPFALAGQSLVNTASVEGEEADPHTENNQSAVTTTVGPASDLSITKTMGKAEAGQPLIYTLAVSNNGPSDSSAVTVKDTLPAGTIFKTTAPSQGTCSAAGQSVTCELGPLAAGASAQVSITVDVAATASGTLRNVATVEGPEPDPDKSNNESSVEGPVAPVPPAPPIVPTNPIAPAAPNLKVVKTADTSTPEVGKPFDYHVAITNLSGGEAKNVRLVDTLNGPVKVLSIEPEAGSCHADGSTITCQVPSIAVGKTVEVTYSVVAESTGPLSNTASAQASNGEVAPANNHAVKAVKAKAPKKATYSLTKTASRKVVAGGKKLAFEITLRNGAAALTDAKVCDRLPAPLVFVKAAGARYVNGEACWTKNYVAPHKVLRLHLVARAVKGYKSRRARNVATARADNAAKHSAAATVRIKPAFAGRPGGVTG